MKKVLVILLLVFCAGMVYAQSPSDVPSGHWAYEAVKELANKGYVVGYQDGTFLGNRTMSRYEFAVIVKRVLDEMDGKIAAVEAKQASDATTSNSVNVKPISLDLAEKANISTADVENISKLVDEFKVELTVIGTRLDKVEATVDELKGKVDNIDAIVSDPEGTLQTAKDDLTKLKKITLSGYLQARYQSMAFDNEYKSEKDQYDTFDVRRARIKLVATPTDRSTAVFELACDENTISPKDAYYQYAFGDNATIAPSFTLGQQYWWFGYENTYSSSKRECPEQSVFIRRFFPGERDTGFVLWGPTGKSLTWKLGAYNGTGIKVGKDSAVDRNDAKDLVTNVRWSHGDLDLGVSGYWGKGVWTSFANKTYNKDIDKVRYGADLQYYLNNITLKGEFIRGKGFDDVPATPIQDQWVNGYDAQIGYNVDQKDTLVARYSFMSKDPIKLAYGEVTSWDFGVVRWLDSNSKFKLFYKINNEQFQTDAAAKDNNGFVAEWLVTF